MDDAAPTRTDEIAEAATDVFLRYGFRKTSMDDLATAAGLSRQGLYLHFKTKEALFHAALRRMVARVETAAREVLDRDDVTLPDRLLETFEAVHGDAVAVRSDRTAELLDTATTLGKSLLQETEQNIIRGVAAVLSSAGVDAVWRKSGIAAEDLAHHLYAASTGIRLIAATPADYRTHMRIAIKIVVDGQSRA